MWKGQNGVLPTGPLSALMVVDLGKRPFVLSTLQQFCLGLGLTLLGSAFHLLSCPLQGVGKIPFVPPRWLTHMLLKGLTLTGSRANRVLTFNPVLVGVQNKIK